MFNRSQIQQFKTEGYLIAPEFFSGDELRAIQAEANRFRAEGLLQNVATQGDGSTATTDGVNMQLVPLANDSELFTVFPFANKVIEATSELLGNPVVKILDQLFLKPAGTGLPTNWHTDNSYFRIKDPLKGLALWIAVDDATRENGTLKVVPRAFSERHKHFRDPDSNHHIRMEVDEADAVHCEVSAGSVVFFAFGTPHATGPNPSNRDRTGIGVHFINGDYNTDELSERNPAGEPVYTTSDHGQSLDPDKSEQWQALVLGPEGA